MTDDEIRARYDALLFTGKNTQEKHVRWVAEQLMKTFQDGFYTRSGPDPPQAERCWVAWRCEGRSEDILVSAPPGLHGFALQLVIEAQIRSVVFDS